MWCAWCSLQYSDISGYNSTGAWASGCDIQDFYIKIYENSNNVTSNMGVKGIISINTD